MNQIYFIGAGPGDPQLLTLQGYSALQKAETVYLSPPFDETFAGYLQAKKVLIPFDFDFADLLEMIEQQRQVAPVAFLLPGDLTFFSPYQALIEHFSEAAVVIAGVGSTNAASAVLQRTLILPSVCSRAIVVSPKTLAGFPDAPDIEDLAAPGVSLLIYMNTIPLPELVAKLRRGYAEDVPIALLHRLGLPDEKIIQSTLDSIVDDCQGQDYFFLAEPEKKPALTLVIVGESLVADVDGSWWDEKRKTTWKKT